MFQPLIIIAELILVALSLFLADASQGWINIIPEFIIHLPDVTYTVDDFWIVFRYFLVVHFVVFLAVQWALGPWKIDDAKRTAEEIFALAAAFAISTLAIFVTTSVAFDPHFIANVGFSNGLLFIIIHFLISISKGKQLGSVLLNLLTMLGRRLRSTTGILVILLALSPVVLAKLFVSDRDVANFITQIRIYWSDNSSSAYTLSNALENQLFHQPMLVRTAPNDQTRLYILERSGRLLSVPYLKSGEVKVELDIRDKVGKVEVENGALGFDFHPDFGKLGSENTGSIYIYYTDVRKGKQVNRVSRFDLNVGSKDKGSTTEIPLIVLERNDSGFHNGGSLEFGPDGFLYIAIGEGVYIEGYKSQGTTLRKGILRIDVDRRGGDVSHPIVHQPATGHTMNYFIPNDNPFIGIPNILEEYWAIGLRNPFRISFDSETNSLWAGEVGTTKWEEVNLIHKGGHYQYPFVEGNEPTGVGIPSQIIGTEYGPRYTYVHTAFDRAVIGGFVYRGGQFRELQGLYIFADNYSSKVFSMPGDGRKVDKVSLLTRADQFAQRGISSISQLTNGDVLVTTLGRATEPTGEVLRLEKITDHSASLPQDRSDELRERPISPEEARAIFVTNCARCHGSTGKGDGPDSLEMEVGILNFASPDFQNSRTDEQLRLVIMEGGEKVGLSKMMPPWKGILEPNEVEALIKLLRGFKAS